MNIIELTTTIGAIFTSFGAGILYLKKQGFFESHDVLEGKMKEYLFTANQTGKQETSGLMDAMHRKLDHYHQDHIQRLDKIETHLATLNGKVIKHGEEIAVLKVLQKTHTQMRETT